MLSKQSLPGGDRKLVQIVDAALAQNAAKSGDFLACRAGCSQCCIGVFEISQLDAARLRQGLAELDRTDPKRARQIRLRAQSSMQRLRPGFPGNKRTGVLATGAEGEEAFANFGNDEPCPALDPETETCDLYSHRPMTCRVFGPPVRSGTEGGLGVCELCFQGATKEQIAACELVADPDDLESKVTKEYEKSSGHHGKTIVAWCLAE